MDTTRMNIEKACKCSSRFGNIELKEKEDSFQQTTNETFRTQRQNQ